MCLCALQPGPLLLHAVFICHAIFVLQYLTAAAGWAVSMLPECIAVSDCDMPFMHLQACTKPTRHQSGPPTANPYNPATTAPVLSTKPKSPRMLQSPVSTQPTSGRLKSPAPLQQTRLAPAATLVAMPAAFYKLLIYPAPPRLAPHSERRAMLRPAALRLPPPACSPVCIRLATTTRQRLLYEN